MPRCKICSDKFEPKYFLQKSCLKPNCILEWSKAVKDKKAKSEWNKKVRERKPYTPAKEFKANLQSQINLLARKIDNHFNYSCIDCGKPYGKQVDGAHFHNVGGNENIRYNLHNIHSARAHCNQYDSEHKKRYPEGIEKRYGKDYLRHVSEELPIKYSYLGLNELEIVEALKRVRKINREFEKLIKNTESDGAGTRDYFNELIGIYVATV